MSVISELRRRQVFRAAAWYGGLAWLAIEVASTVFPQFGLPEWSVRAVIVAAMLGLPVAVALAWWFDLSAMGLRREVDATPPAATADSGHAATAAAPSALWRMPSFWIALVIGAGVAITAQQAWQRIVRPAAGERPGLAVLPFANLSPDPANAYFADGLHEEILATFARAGGLRVISRTSVQTYRDTSRNLRQIADALDVSLILEGSVRRDGDDLRLTLQLIDGRTDEHVWAETYDRKFRDALALQRAVAEQVVAAIGATLTPTEQRLIAASAPSNPEAYEFYLHALTRWNQFASEPELRLLIGLLDRTIELDPGFALAYALRAKARVWFVTAHAAAAGTKLSEGARADIARALELESDLPEALAARGLYSTYVTRDAAAGLEDLMRAIAVAPNDPDTHNAAGLTLRRLGRFDEAVEQFRAAMELAPAEANFGFRTRETLHNLGRLDEAREVSGTLQRRFPELPYGYLHPYWYRCLEGGDLTGWREELERRAEQLPPDALAIHRERFLLCTGDIAGLASLLEQTPADSEFGEDRDYRLGVVYMALGDPGRARPHLLAAAAQAVRTPDDAWTQVRSAVAMELLGRRAAALAAADEAIRLSSQDYDAVNGPLIAFDRAWVLIRSGSRAEEGYVELGRWLGGYQLQPGAMTMEPLWLILRNDARVQQIFAAAMEKQNAGAAKRSAVTPPAPAVAPSR
jgi:TolB-like protein/Flp pilus assembly protein TadD